MSHDRYEDFETGENPPKYKRRIFAEHLSVYTKPGPFSEVERRYNPSAWKRTHGGLSDAERADAEKVWARLPRFDDVVKGRA